MSEEQQISRPDPTPSDQADRAGPDDPSMGRSLALVRYLRERCPWDAKQTPDSLLPYLLEEAHEVADAVRRADDAELAGELGDLLLNVAFQVVLAEERAAFGIGDVVAALERKMRERHPHVYGDAEEPPDWEEMKALGRPNSDDGSGDPFAGVPPGLEPLSRAMRVQDRAAGVGFDWPDASGALDKLREEIAELEPLLGAEMDRGRLVEEAGDLLFAAVNVCRLADVHPMTALVAATGKFSDRFRALLARAASDGLAVETASLETLDRLWEAVKSSERESD